MGKNKKICFRDGLKSRMFITLHFLLLFCVLHREMQRTPARPGPVPDSRALRVRCAVRSLGAPRSTACPVNPRCATVPWPRPSAVPSVPSGARGVLQCLAQHSGLLGWLAPTSPLPGTRQTEGTRRGAQVVPPQGEGRAAGTQRRSHGRSGRRAGKIKTGRQLGAAQCPTGPKQCKCKRAAPRGRMSLGFCCRCWNASISPAN